VPGDARLNYYNLFVGRTQQLSLREYINPALAPIQLENLATKQVFSEGLRAYAASHHAGVFHRDLKPSNIMVSRDPGIRNLKVTDFGIAKMAEEEIAEAFKDKESTTGSQTVMGALPYMAPEMIEKS
jgi:serine/threonine protein kinase